MTHMIKDLVGTRYLYVSIGQDLDHIIRTCQTLRDNPEANYFAGNKFQEQVYEEVKAGGTPTFDFADTKITSDVATQSMLRFVHSGFNLIDSKNAKRNEIFAESLRRIREAPKDAVPLPELKPRQNPKDYIKSLSLECQYALPNSFNKQMRSLVIMATMLRPKLRFVVGNTHRDMFEYIASFLTPEILERYEEFYYCSPEGIEVLKLRNGKLSIQRLGEVSILDAASAGYLVPTAFGTERLFEDPVWRPLFDSCYGILQQYEREQKKHLHEVIHGGPLSSVGGQ